MNERLYLFADRVKDTGYNATEIIKGTLDESLWQLEYGDVRNKEFQIWEYPTGKIFQVEPDRLNEEDSYAPPSKNSWLPVLTQVGVDKPKVTEAYYKLINETTKQSLLTKIREKFSR